MFGYTYTESKCDECGFVGETNVEVRVCSESDTAQCETCAEAEYDRAAALYGGSRVSTPAQDAPRHWAKDADYVESLLDMADMARM